MAAVTADSVAVEFLARSTKYEADLDRIYAKTKKTIDDLNKLTAKPIQVNAGAAATDTAETKRRASRKKAIDDDVKSTEQAEQKKRKSQKATDDSREEASRRRLASLDRQIAEENRKLDNQSKARRARAEGDWRANMAAQRRDLQGGTSLGSRTQRVSADGLTYGDIRSEVGAAMNRSRIGAASGDKAAAQALRDQQLYLRLINQYKERGLSATEAQEKAERRLAEVVRRRSAQESEAARKRMEQSLRQNQASVGSGIRNAAIGIAGGISVREISALNDKYIEFTNQLKIAGVEGANQKIVQDALLASAQKYGVELGVLGSLFGRATQAGSEFGTTQRQTLDFANAVAAAVKVQGGGVQQASGAILQLTQALQSGNVRAQEFNSLLNGLFPLLQAAAGASDEFGGSVAKLRQKMLEGNLTSKEFFDLILKSLPELQAKAEKATLTTAAGFTALTSSLVIYFGEADKANGVSAAIGEALAALSRNLDTVIPAIAAVAVTMGGQYVLAAIRAAALTREMSVAALALRGSLVALQTVGIAAVIGALASLYTEGVQSHQNLKDLQQASAEFGIELSKTSQAALAAGDGTKQMGDSAKRAEPELWSLKNASSALTAQLYDQAKAARQARLDTLDAQIAQSKAREQQAINSTNGGARANSRGAFSALGQGDILQFFSLAGDSLKSDARNVLSGGRTQREAQARLADERTLQQRLNAERSLALNSRLTERDLPSGGGSGGAPSPLSKQIAKTQAKIDNLEKSIASGLLSPARLASAQKQLATQRNNLQLLNQGINPAGISAGGRGSGDSAAKKAEQLRLDALRDEQAYNRELSRSRNDAASAQAELAGNIEDQARIAKARLDDEAAEYADEIRNRQSQGRFGSGELAQKRADELIKARNDALQAEKDSIDRRLKQDQAQRGRDIASSDAEIERDRLRDEDQMATTRKARLDAQLSLLGLELEERKRALESQLETERDQSKRDAIQRQIDALPDVQARGQRAIERENAGPLDKYVRGLTERDTATEAEQFVVDRLNEVNDGITGALQKAIGTKDPIIGSLLNMLVKEVIMKPLAQALQSANGGAGGSGISGLLSSIGSLFGGGGSAPARASGGGVVAGKMYRVNDGGRGVEGFRPAQSGTIIPLGRMAATRSTGVTVNQTVRVDARNSVNPDGFARDILSVSNAQAQKAGAASYAQGQQSTPGTINKYSQLRG